jgi:hypothetical protein
MSCYILKYHQRNKDIPPQQFFKNHIHERLGRWMAHLLVRTALLNIYSACDVFGMLSCQYRPPLFFFDGTPT